MSIRKLEYTPQTLREDGHVTDVVVHISDGKSWRMWGRKGTEREKALAEQVPQGSLPVLLGAGLGICLPALLERGPVILVDREGELARETGVWDRVADHPNLTHLNGEPEAVLEGIAAVQRELGNEPLHMVRIPLYLRLDAPYYREIEERVAARNEFQGAVRYPKFERVQPRVLILERPYFLYREIQAALDVNGSERRSVLLPDSGMLEPSFIQELLTAVADFKPDFALTVNHFGMDREGRLAGLLEEMGLPLASWFVDSPQLIMNEYPRQNTPGTSVFTYDQSSTGWLEKAGFQHVRYLPLATDPQRFKPGGESPAAWRAEVSFVGDSMTSQVAAMTEAARVAPVFHANLDALAHAFARSEHVLPMEFLAMCHADVHAEVGKLQEVDDRLACEKALTFMAARQYRLRCVSGILPYSPLIAGDEGWSAALGTSGWRSVGRLDYYRDLPVFYGASEVNFNCTSVQMKGAVNQRVFDVPACGGFLVTDWREQMEQLFDPETEVACYHDPGEVEDVVAAWLTDPVGRQRMAELARTRILSEHTYAHRLRTLVTVMRETYGGC